MRARLISITKRILLNRAQKERLKMKGAAVRPLRLLMHPLPPKILPLRPWRSLMQVQVFTTLSTPCSTSQCQQGRLVPNLNMAEVTYTTSMQCMEVNMRRHPHRHILGIQHIQGRLMLMHIPRIMGMRSMDSSSRSHTTSWRRDTFLFINFYWWLRMTIMFFSAVSAEKKAILIGALPLSFLELVFCFFSAAAAAVAAISKSGVTLSPLLVFYWFKFIYLFSGTVATALAAAIPPTQGSSPSSFWEELFRLFVAVAADISATPLLSGRTLSY